MSGDKNGASPKEGDGAGGAGTASSSGEAAVVAATKAGEKDEDMVRDREKDRDGRACLIVCLKANHNNAILLTTLVGRHSHQTGYLLLVLLLY